MNSPILISLDRGWGFQPILSGKVAIARLDSDIIPIVLADRGKAGMVKCLIVIYRF